MQEPAGRRRWAMGICALGWSGWRSALPIEWLGSGATSAFGVAILRQVEW